MRDVLRKFFNFPGVFKTVFVYYQQLFYNVDVIEDFVQGNLWPNKVKDNFSDKTVFPLFVYFDDYENNNPLGSHKTIDKSLSI